MSEPIRPAAQIPEHDRHLDRDALSAVLDRALDPADQATAETHLTRCAACAADLAELRATVNLLQGLPHFQPRRAFTLGPEHARRPRAAAERDPMRLLPSVPALRMATLAVAALLLLAIVGEWTVGRSASPGFLNQAAPVSAPQEEEAAPTSFAVLAPAPAAQEAAPADEGAAPASDAALPEPAARAMLPGAPDAQLAPTADLQAAEGTVDRVPASDTVGERAAPRSGLSPWRLVQIGLALTLLWLLVSLVGLGAVRRMRDQP